MGAKENMTELRGIWPGGPSRDGDVDAAPGRSRRLRTMEERSSARSDASMRRSRRNRSTRLLWGFFGAVVVAGLAGWGVGLRAHRTQEELLAELMAEAQQGFPTGDLESILKGQSEKVIQQMWLTEIMDAQRSR